MTDQVDIAADGIPNGHTALKQVGGVTDVDVLDLLGIALVQQPFQSLHAQDVQHRRQDNADN